MKFAEINNINMSLFNRILLCFLLFSVNVFSQKMQQATFKVVPLGIKGGIDEKNLSAYLLAPINTNDYISLDAGTINSGIEKAIENKVFKVSTNTVLRKFIKGYLISHAHLDHVSGMIINSAADSSKTVYATNKCMEMMQKHYFNDEAWINFGDKGLGKPLNMYHFQTLNIDEETPITNTSMTVKAFRLSHVNPFESTAFLIKNAESYVLYLGDTGPDVIEKSNDLHDLWTVIAPLIKSKQLKGIFIEVSFPNEQPDQFLFGHLTPNYLMKELHALEEISGRGTLKGFKIIITHLKPPSKNIVKIKEQLKKQNDLGVKIIYPVQGKRFEL